MEGVARPDGAALVDVAVPSAKGLRLEACSTWGLKETGAGAAGVDVTTATAGLVGVAGGGARGGGAWVMGDTTLIGLWGFGSTKDGGAFTVGWEE